MTNKFTHWYKVLKMETLLDGEGDHHPYQPSTIALLTATIKVEEITTLQMDGFSTIISFGYQVKKGNLQ